jgi:IS1 family transposase
MANNLSTEKKTLAVSMLAEGNSIRSIERVTGVHRDTIMRLGVRIGEGCAKLHDQKMRGLGCKQIEVDEIWGFIGAKRKNADRTGNYGDVWTFIALDSETKLIPSFVVGKRDAYHTKMFIADLADRVSNRIQLSSDAMNAYADAVERGFGTEVDYGQIEKTYSVTNLNKDAASRYTLGATLTACGDIAGAGVTSNDRRTTGIANFPCSAAFEKIAIATDPHRTAVESAQRFSARINVLIQVDYRRLLGKMRGLLQ